MLELAEGIPGPYCGRLLAGYGADVLKIESPQGGDLARSHPPFPGDRVDPEASGLFLFLNTGKRGITIDWRPATGRELLRRLIAEADVLIESAGPEAMEALGLDGASRQRDFPKLVLVSVSAFGSFGPYRDYRATEGVAAALSGLMSLTGEPDREPLKNGGYLLSYGCGQYAFTAAVAALYAGAGEHIETSVLDNAMTVVEVAPQMTAADGKVRRRLGNVTAPGWALYPCADGWVAVALEYRKDLTRAAKAMGIDELLDPRFDDFVWGHSEHGDEITALLVGWFLPRTRQEIYEVAQANHLPWGYVAFPEDMLADPQLQAREFFEEFDHPVAGRQTYPGAPFTMSETPWRTGRAPLLGEHNAEVYSALGLSPSDLSNLRAAGVV